MAARHMRQGIILPFPPTLNNAFPTNRQGKRFKSTAYKAFQKETAKWLLTQKPKVFRGEVTVTMYLYRPRRVGDIDNYSKVIFDTLKGVCFEDDSQIVELHIYRHDDKEYPRVELIIEEK